MRRINLTLAVGLTVTVATLFVATLDAAHPTSVTIGTGALTGIYYPTGGTICYMVNSHKAKHGIACRIENTAGSEYNARMIEAGKLEFGVVQSDVGYNAFAGVEPFAEKAAQLRSVFSLHTETLTLVALKSAGIQKLADIKGKRVNLGNPGSGPRQSVLHLLKACGLKQRQLAKAGSLHADEVTNALLDNRLDAYFHFVGHPSPNIESAATFTDIDLVDISGSCIDKLVAERPFYVKATIPAGTYRGVDNEVETISTRATLLASKAVPEQVVYHLVKSIFDNLQEFKDLHPIYEGLTAESMTRALPVPWHRGAVKYFKEKGLK